MTDDERLGFLDGLVGCIVDMPHYKLTGASYVVGCDFFEAAVSRKVKDCRLGFGSNFGSDFVRFVLRGDKLSVHVVHGVGIFCIADRDLVDRVRGFIGS